MENNNITTEWVYGCHKGYGWGAAEYNTETFEILDFDPEWETESDVYYFWKLRKNILKLKKMTYYKYTKLLLKGLKRKYYTKCLSK